MCPSKNCVNCKHTQVQFYNNCLSVCGLWRACFLFTKLHFSLDYIWTIEMGCHGLLWCNWSNSSQPSILLSIDIISWEPYFEMSLRQGLSGVGIGRHIFCRLFEYVHPEFAFCENKIKVPVQVYHICAYLSVSRLFMFLDEMVAQDIQSTLRIRCLRFTFSRDTRKKNSCEYKDSIIHVWGHSNLILLHP